MAGRQQMDPRFREDDKIRTAIPSHSKYHEASMIFDILAGAVVIGVGGWAWNKLLRRWADNGKRF